MKQLAIIFLLSGVVSFAQNKRSCDPNEGLGLEPGVAEGLCNYAYTNYAQDQSYYPGLVDITPFEVALITAATKKYDELAELSMKATRQDAAGQEVTVKIPKEWKKEAGIWWKEVGHKIYCVRTMDNIDIDGYLNDFLLRSLQHASISRLYSKKGPYHADVNLIVPLNPCEEDSPPATFIDIIDHALANPIGQMEVSRGIRENFRSYRETYVSGKHNGKKASELLER